MPINPAAFVYKYDNPPVADAPGARTLLASRQLAAQKQQNAVENAQRGRELDLKKGYFDLEKQAREHALAKEAQAEVEGLIAKYRAARASGNSVEIDAIGQELKRRGIQVETEQSGFLGPKANGGAAGGAPGVFLSKANSDQESPAEDAEESTEEAPTDIAAIANDSAALAKSLAAPPPKETRPETTELSDAQEWAFQKWARKNAIRDVDDPRAHYDYRGFWLETEGAPVRPGQHFPDTYKQHGHPTFSVESQYSNGDGGRWEAEKFVPELSPAPAPASQATPSQRLPGEERFVLRDKGGNVLYASPGAEFMENERRVGDALSPLQKSGDPEIDAIGKQAHDIAAGLVRSGVPVGTAYEKAMEFYKLRSDQLQRGRRALAHGGHPGALSPAQGFGKGEVARMGGINDDVSQIIGQVATHYQFGAGVAKAEGMINRSLALLNNGSGMGQEVALQDLEHMLSGAALNNTELEGLLGSTGSVNRIHDMVSRALGDATKAPEIIRQLNQTFVTAAQEAKRRRKEAAETAYERVMRSASAMTPDERLDQAANAYYYFMHQNPPGYGGRGGGAGAKQQGGSKQPATPLKKGGAGAQFLKKFGL